MTTAIAICKIRLADPSGGLAELIAQGAARLPTKEEIALRQLATQEN